MLCVNQRNSYNAGVLCLRTLQVDIGRLDDMNAAADTMLVVYITASLYLLFFFQGSFRAPVEIWYVEAYNVGKKCV